MLLPRGKLPVSITAGAPRASQVFRWRPQLGAAGAESASEGDVCVGGGTRERREAPRDLPGGEVTDGAVPGLPTEGQGDLPGLRAAVAAPAPHRLW